MAYHSLNSLINKCKKDNLEIWQVVVEEQAKETLEDEGIIFNRMKDMFLVMKATLDSYDKLAKSHSNMAGGDGEKIHQYNKNENKLLGPFLSQVIENAVKTAESNACMKRIVAAPTAGSCGVIPAVLISYQSIFNISNDEITKALLVSAGIGSVIAENASISGAKGGCQAEIGCASAMAAGAIAYLESKDNEKIVNAVALAIKNMMGLVCDPVAGLVEVPCIKRNASGAVNAVTSAYMALCGIKSVIPADEVIGAMDEVGKNLPSCYKETSLGGLAVTPTAKKIAKAL